MLIWRKIILKQTHSNDKCLIINERYDVFQPQNFDK